MPLPEQPHQLAFPPAAHEAPVSPHPRQHLSLLVLLILAVARFFTCFSPGCSLHSQIA